MAYIKMAEQLFSYFHVTRGSARISRQKNVRYNHIVATKTASFALQGLCKTQALVPPPPPVRILGYLENPHTAISLTQVSKIHCG